MPGLLQMEALVEMSALTVLTLPGNTGKIVYIASANNMNFARKIVVGDRLDSETKLHSFWARYRQLFCNKFSYWRNCLLGRFYYCDAGGIE